ncbi:MAG TPA: SCO family protein [Phycisphaerales bacterium]|nr:SCO family protein [Phycisphaerales bacterium]HRQ76612.1 SCO family protein [Phycisphaerales bacterium]
MFVSLASSRLTVFASLLAACAVAAPAMGQLLKDELPPENEGVGQVQRLGESVSLDLEFTDEYGNRVKLGDFFSPGRPVILTLNYYSCPMLCHLTLNGLLEGLREITWTAGQEFQIVTISIKPTETADDAKAYKEAYIRRYGREGVDQGWRFLVGDQRNIEAIAYQTGFGYKILPNGEDYAHPSTITFITPDGRISKYINDVMFPSRDLRFALVEASQGGIGGPMERFLLLTCYQYDPNSGSYVPVAWKLMRTGGALTLALLSLTLFVLWLRGGKYDRKNRPHESAVALGGMNS